MKTSFPLPTGSSRFGAWKGSPLRIGYVPLLDSAPILVAHHLGMFEDEGLTTILQRQPGWACVRDKMLYGELDAANAPAGILFAINAGVTSNVGRCVTAFVTSAQGNGITLSSDLRARGILDLADLKSLIRKGNSRKLVLGVVSRFSSHAHLLTGWLRKGGIGDEEARIVVLPPQQMVTCLATGHIDGFCAGEPWNSLAVEEGSGWVAADSAALAPMHPEKVLLVHEDFARARHEEHMAMLRALKEACLWCGEEENRPEMAELLRTGIFHDIPRTLIEGFLAGPLAPVFSAEGLHEPSLDKAGWILSEMRRAAMLPEGAADQEMLACFRADIFKLMDLSGDFDYD